MALGDLTAAQQTLAQAVQLEPTAERLPQLWCELYAAQGDAAQLAARATAWREQQPAKAQPHFYLALAALLTGDAPQVQTALVQVLSCATADDRQSFRETLMRLQAQWPAQQAALQQLYDQFQEETP
ncbi:MAG: hypothetical protein R3C14_36690 [Caldilineaceae bacterium]